MVSTNFRSEKLGFKKYYSDHYATLDNARLTFHTLIASMLSAETDISVYSIVSRVKDREESVRKFVRKYQQSLEASGTPYEIKDYINDLIGVRVVLLYEPDIHKVGNILSSEFEVLGVTDKSKALENKADAFGYKGLHLDLKLSTERSEMREYKPYAELRFEVQIRTIIQDAWSVLDHQIKYKKAIPQYLARRINSLAALFEIADGEFLSIHQATQLEEQKAGGDHHGDENIDVFTFTRIVKDKCPELSFDETRAAECIDMLFSYGDLSYNRLANAIDHYKAIVLSYFSQIQNDLKKSFRIDVYVFLSHVLYASDPHQYKGILLDFAEKSFNEYMKTQPHVTPSLGA